VKVDKMRVMANVRVRVNCRCLLERSIGKYRPIDSSCRQADALISHTLPEQVGETSDGTANPG